MKIRSAGFTLVEIIVGLVLGTLAISMVATLIFPLYTRSVEPMLQIRASEMAQAILDDALARNYDQLTPVGGQPPCSPCTGVGSLGVDGGEANRADFNDVDDYDAFCGSFFDIQNVLGDVLSASDEYGGFEFQVCVNLDGNYNGTVDEAGDEGAKLVTVTVRPPSLASTVIVSAYRTNY